VLLQTEAGAHLTMVGKQEREFVLSLLVVTDCREPFPRWHSGYLSLSLLHARIESALAVALPLLPSWGGAPPAFIVPLCLLFIQSLTERTKL